MDSEVPDNIETGAVRMKTYQLRPVGVIEITMPDDALWLDCGERDVTIYSDTPATITSTMCQIPRSWRGQHILFMGYNEDKKNIGYLA
jgi:hypothetical protein